LMGFLAGCGQKNPVQPHRLDVNSTLLNESAVYWVEFGKIRSANLNDRMIRDVLGGTTHRPSDIEIDSEAGLIFWTGHFSNHVWRSRIDGSDMKVVLTTQRPRRLALDVVEKKLYLTRWEDADIVRSDYEGAMIETLVQGDLQVGRPVEIVLDKPRRKMYWTDISANRIRRANMDGSEVEDLITSGLEGPYGLDLDLRSGKMYWTELTQSSGRTPTRIRRANLDGSGIEEITPEDLPFPSHISLDIDAGRMYWRESSRIRSATLDGDDIRVIVDEVYTGSNLDALALDLEKKQIYWGGNSRISRANIDGSRHEFVIDSGPHFPYYLSIDESQGQLFWADTDRIMCANLDGTGLQTLVSADNGLKRAWGLAIDTEGGKMYWANLTSRSFRKMQRSNLDGSNVEDIIDRTNLGFGITPIKLDLTERELYWSTRSRIYRAGLDGSNITVVVSGMDRIQDIALDTEGKLIYWVDTGAKKIQRAHMNTREIENLLDAEDGLGWPCSIALSLNEGKLYWSDQVTDMIHRSNLDGTEIEDIISSGLTNPGHIALLLKGTD
ncbi:hypothetical protein MJD09_24755, partial [bacterium]|nr:hypothetical protein [bacterium]